MSRNYHFLRKKRKIYIESIQNEVDNSNSETTSKQLTIDEPKLSEETVASTSGSGRHIGSSTSSISNGENTESEINSDSDIDIEVHNEPQEEENDLYHTDQSSDNDVDNSKAIMSANESDTGVSLKQWALKNNISHSALNQLLQILNRVDLNLPQDARTLLGTTSKKNIEKFEIGEFCYYGVKENLMKFLEGLKPESLSKMQNLCLNFNIDGVPLYHSSTICFWPILLTVHDIEMMPLVVAIYCGPKKPDIDLYLKEFVSEMNSLKYITVYGKKYDIHVRSFIADAPAKAFLKQIKQHGAFFACDKCHTKGLYNRKAHSVSYDITIQKPRTDNEFRTAMYPKHHDGKSPLQLLQIDMVNTFPFDYMHVVLLGVMRKLLHLWLCVIPFKLDDHLKKAATKNLSECAQYLPLEFNRKPHDIRDGTKWKATECRTFILYVGLLSLHNIISEDKYNHFSLLSIAIRILCSTSFSEDYDLIDYAETLLKKFVKDYKIVYEGVSIVYNVHALLHLPDDVRQLGPLDTFSAFPFENFLGIMKRRIRSGSRPLAQITRRISELSGTNFCEKSIRTNKKVTKIADFNIRIGEMKNSCVIFNDGTLGIIVKQVQDTLHVRKFTRKLPLFESPIDTGFLYLYRVKDKTKNVLMNEKEIKAKCFICPFLGDFAVIPIL